jgi:hypothetical protein
MGGRDCCAPRYLHPKKGITGIPDYYKSWDQAVFRTNKPSFLMTDIILNLPRSRSSGMPSSPPHLGDFHINERSEKHHS